MKGFYPFIMNIMFNDTKIESLTEIESFLRLTSSFKLKSIDSLKERAEWINQTLIKFKYHKLKKKDKKIVKDYLCAVSGCKERTIKYHINAYKNGKKVCDEYERNSFAKIYTNEDIELLAETDNLHSRLNGAATKRICEEMVKAGDKRYEKLAKISVSHLYNLRGNKKYKENSVTVGKTKSVERPIGERKKPEPNGEPGHIRVDTVHQGDKNGQKGVYHINLVDEVTQWQIITAVEGISEAFLIEPLEEAINEFPFEIHNFHSDNGSEFINHQVAALLNKLLIKQTKSRSRHSNDNGLVESKNGHVIRKHMGFSHIPKKFASRINLFYKQYFIPYINFARPSSFSREKSLGNGKIKKTYLYEDYKTPLQKLLSLPKINNYLKKCVTIESLKQQENEKTPNQRAYEMQQAKNELLKVIFSLPSDII
jgi:hypothetical protein